MQLHSKAVAILILFLFLFASVVPMISGNYGLDNFNPDNAPFTTIIIDSNTAIITLVAVDYPLNKGSGVKATYYKLDGGPQIEYTEPFKVKDGTHTIEYWSIDNWSPPNVECHKTATFTVDTTPPTVEITSPLPGGIYFLGNKIFNLGSTAICIGKVPIEVSANDGDGSGVESVFFNIENDTGYDSSAPYQYTYKGTRFGELTITATAIDKTGWMSEPDKMTVTVLSLGIL